MNELILSISTLEAPDELIPGESGEEIAVKRFDDRQVRVVYREADAGSFVIDTAMKPRVHD